MPQLIEDFVETRQNFELFLGQIGQIELVHKEQQLIFMTRDEVLLAVALLLRWLLLVQQQVHLRLQLVLLVGFVTDELALLMINSDSQDGTWFQIQQTLGLLLRRLSPRKDRLVGSHIILAVHLRQVIIPEFEVRPILSYFLLGHSRKVLGRLSLLQDLGVEGLQLLVSGWAFAHWIFFDIIGDIEDRV